MKRTENMKSILVKCACFFLCLIAAALLCPATARADMGPKPSVRITFENMGDEVCYGTLLSERSSTGPASAWDGNEDHIYNYGLDLDIWRAFAEYEDTNGYYFLQEGWLVSESKELNWGYYPPSPFKILLYYPEQDAFVVSGICQRYAFDSYFTVDMEGIHIGAVQAQEAVLYSMLFPKISQRELPGWKPALYALVANGVSFAGGLLIAKWIPGIF